MRKRTLIQLVIGAVIIAALSGLYVSYGGEFRAFLHDYLLAFLEWVRGFGVLAPVLLGAAYVLAAVLMIPGSILTLGAGFIFGIVEGAITVSVAATLGAAAAFLVGRTLVRGWVERRLSGSRRFRAIDHAVGRSGFRIVLLTRLSPVLPFNLLNYAYGVTGVSFWSYFLASWIGMIPGTLMYVYFGSAAKNLTELAAHKSTSGTAARAYFYAGLAVTIVVAVLVAHVARRALAESVPEAVDDECEAGGDEASG